jgi:hypothetical protein
MSAFSTFVLSALLAAPLASQQPVTVALRQYTKSLAERAILAANAMPEDLYSFKPTPRQASFAMLVTRLSQRTEYLCSRLSSAQVPVRPALPATADKTTLVARLRETFDLCDDWFDRISDAQAADSITVDMREAFPFAPRKRTRAEAMTLATAYWADMYAQMGQYLRLNGRVPPVPCARDVDETTTCDSGWGVCRPTPQGGFPAIATLSDGPYSIRSDGRGSYVHGVDGATVWAGNVLVIVWLYPTPRDAVNPRTVLVDLTKPLPGGNGTPLGIIAERSGEVHAQWYSEADKSQHNTVAIPDGTKVTAQQANVVFSINGVRHALQMGPQPLGHCFSDGSVMHGEGTTTATIERTTETQFVVDLPPGSIGRLFDIHLGEPNAVDKGLYNVSLRYVIQRKP